MKFRSLIRISVFAISLSSLAGSALAQTSVGKWNCQEAAPAQMRMAYGDREGHDLYVSDYTCTVDDGPMAGGVVVGRNFMEFRDGGLNLVSGNGVIRAQSGAFVVFQNSELKLPFTMKDGRPAGWTGGGKYRFSAAGGSWAPFAGKNVAWTGGTTGAYRFATNNVIAD